MSLTVVGMEGYAVNRDPLGIFVLFDFDAVRIVRTHLMQGQNMRPDQPQQHQRHAHDVQGIEAVQGGVGHHEVTPDYQLQGISNPEGDGAEQGGDDLGAPVGHLPPGQQVTEKGLRHQGQINDDAEQPQQLALALVGSV